MMEMICTSKNESGTRCEARMRQTDIFQPEGSRRKFQRYVCPRCKFTTCQSITAEKNWMNQQKVVR